MYTPKVTKVAIATLIMSSAAAFALASPAKAQHAAGAPHVNSKALEHVNFYNAPREIQIIDDRPVVRDFREAPSQTPSIDLPPGPTAGGGAAGGSGAGALDGGGGPANIPAGGLHLPGIGTDPGYRTPAGMGIPLPKSGFGREGTNIPARGMGSRDALPDGSSTNRLMGKMLNPSVVKGVAAGPSRGMAPTTGRTAGHSSTPVATYSGGYGSGTGNATGGSANRSEGLVRGSLLRH